MPSKAATVQEARCLSGRRRELGDSLGSLTDSVLGEFTRKHETDSSLDLTGAESRLFVVGRELSSFTSDAFEDVVNERVHDRHALLGDSSVGVDLLEHAVNISGVRLHALLGLAFAGGGFLGWCGFRRNSLLGRGFGHGCRFCC